MSRPDHQDVGSLDPAEPRQRNIVMIKKFIATTAIAGALALGAVTPAFAAGEGAKPPVTAEQKAARCEKATARIAAGEAKLAKAPDALAKLRSALDKATAEGKTVRATKIQARIDVLNAKVANATTKLASVKAKVAEKCTTV
jgi:septal ring factor EnvC (AmiA/AmiB activator)